MADRGFRLDWTDKELRTAVRKGARKGLNAAGTDLRREHRQILSRKAVSRPGDPPGQRTGELRKLPRREVRSRRGSLVLRAGFLYGKASRDEMIKAMALTHGGERHGSRGGRLEPRPSIAVVWNERKDRVVATVLAAVRTHVGD